MSLTSLLGTGTAAWLSVTRSTVYRRLSTNGLNPAHVPCWWMNNPTLGLCCEAMIGRADIEESKSTIIVLGRIIRPNSEYTSTDRPSDHTSGALVRCHAHDRSVLLYVTSIRRQPSTSTLCTSHYCYKVFSYGLAPDIRLSAL